MTLLSTLKSRIADDIARDDLATQIANSIEDAIEFYRTKRFFWNETRDATFTTVASQAIYSSSDDADIPLFFDIDDVFLVDSSSQNHRLKKDDPQDLEYLSDTSASTGQPTRWAWFDRSIRLYPIPDAAYTIRPVGAIEKASPASESDANNVWMANGESFELLRRYAKGMLYLHVINNMERATAMLGPNLDGEGGACAAQVRACRSAGSRRRGLGRLTPSQF
jgi:hypothetical protein